MMSATASLYVQRSLFGAALAVLSMMGLVGCSTTSHPTRSSGKLQVVAGENFWGSVASQLGGDKVEVSSLINNPNTDPHDYEPKPIDARQVARANYAIVNGAGYDSWLLKLLNANPVAGRKTLNIGELVGKRDGDNPHLWYSPEYVRRAIDQITLDYKALDPADAAYFDQEHTQLITVGLKEYTDTINAIRQQYQGAPVGATESIFVYLADSLGLKLLTPAKFMTAVAEGEAPTAVDKAIVDSQVIQKQIKVLVFNAQNATPDTNALQQKAAAAGIPVTPFTETLSPANASFQNWQTAQLKALQQALNKATGK